MSAWSRDEPALHNAQKAPVANVESNLRLARLPHVRDTLYKVAREQDAHVAVRCYKHFTLNIDKHYFGTLLCYALLCIYFVRCAFTTVQRSFVQPSLSGSRTPSSW